MALGMQACQCQGNLLGRPVKPQQMAHQAPQDGVRVQLDCGSATAPALQRKALRLDAAIPRWVTAVSLSRFSSGWSRRIPHFGYELLNRWGSQMLHGLSVFTGNVDGQFQKAGFDQVFSRGCSRTGPAGCRNYCHIAGKLRSHN